MKSEDALNRIAETGQYALDAGMDFDVLFRAVCSVDPRQMAKLFAASDEGLAYVRAFAHLWSATLAEAERLTGPEDQRRGADILARRTP